MLERTKATAWWILEPYKKMIEKSPWWMILFNYIWLTMVIAWLVVS